MGGGILQARPGLVIYRFGAGLYYANATRFTEECMRILDEADPKVEWFCLSMSAMADVDYSGAGAIREVISEVKARGATFVVCEAEPGVLDRPAKYGYEAKVDAVYAFVEDVVEAFDARPQNAPPEPGVTFHPAQACRCGGLTLRWRRHAGGRAAGAGRGVERGRRAHRQAAVNRPELMAATSAAWSRSVWSAYTTPKSAIARAKPSPWPR